MTLIARPVTLIAILDYLGVATAATRASLAVTRRGADVVAVVQQVADGSSSDPGDGRQHYRCLRQWDLREQIVDAPAGASDN
jgi:hypothetical protein